MVKYQLEVNEELNKKISILKATKGHKNKKDTLVWVAEQYFKKQINEGK